MTPNFANLHKSHNDTTKRQEYVSDLFDNLAPRYDRFNRWVSFFRDESWRRKTTALLGDKSSGIILDLAAGTGDLANSAIELGASQVHVFDISYEMLSLAKRKLYLEKSISPKIGFEQGSAHLLPFRNQTIDGIVSGFAMRNIFHFLDDVLLEMHRVLKPDGRFAILELSQPQNTILRAGFHLHMSTIMPLIGKLTTGNISPFKYLFETTMTFLTPREFQQRLEKAGFVEVNWRSYLLGGIAIHYGRRDEK